MRQSVDAAWAFSRYETIRARLPQARFDASPAEVADLGEISTEFDVFVFDSFGVLNVGETPIDGAAARLRALRDAGKRVFVLTNAATAPLTSYQGKYASLGFDFTDPEIISSRALLAAAMAAQGAAFRWAVCAPESAQIQELPGEPGRFGGGSEDAAEGFVLLSSSGWTDADQARLTAALEERPRPLYVGNPDLVAPREDGFSREPGSYAHDIADALGLAPRFYGKPFANAFDEVRRRLGGAVDGRRVLMLGDTLHTDILGAAAAGFTSALVTGHGVMRGMDVAACMRESGIRPDYVMPSI